MDIFDKAIIRVGRIISDNQKALKAIDRGKSLPISVATMRKNYWIPMEVVASPRSNSRKGASTLPKRRKALPTRVGITEYSFTSSANAYLH